MNTDHKFKQGDEVEILTSLEPFYRAGDKGRIISLQPLAKYATTNLYFVDFTQHRNKRIYISGKHFVREDSMRKIGDENT